MTIPERPCKIRFRAAYSLVSEQLVGQDMYEFDKYDPSAMREASSPATPYSPFAGATRRAFLLWASIASNARRPTAFPPVTSTSLGQRMSRQ
jgi:hypothetical protein